MMVVKTEQKCSPCPIFSDLYNKATLQFYLLFLLCCFVLFFTEK